MAQSSTSGQRLVGVEREVACLELRKAGLSYRAIAARLNIGKSSAHRAVTRALRKLNEKSTEETDEYRRLQSERLDDLLENLWPNRHKPQYVDRILRVLERRAKLYGLDAPTKSEIAVAGGGPLEIEYINDWRTRGSE